MNCDAYHIFFKNLANPLKTKIITELRQKSMTVSELTEIIKVEQSKLSHALTNLKFCKLVTVKQKGKQRIYSLNKKTILPILKIIDKHRMSYCSGCSSGKK
ncbi:MAG: metalloregulator ArsR/SmtB family transcription factor [Nanoarchaeota archaeon]|jgi:DNA-binding transcriptional ArsR family regulator|nr:metalloregulator ArsR/SmtB family transcription factor [Nanoarchaeota archaeon]